MTAPPRPLRIAVLGWHPGGERYPNTRGLLSGLESLPEVRLYRKRPGNVASLYESSVAGPVQRALLILRIFLTSLADGLRAVFQPRDDGYDAIYVPYPSVPLLLVLAVLPRGRRPPIIADAFVSLYDTIVVDRELVPQHSLRAKLLYVLERKALGVASRVIVDTPANRKYLADLFKLPEHRVASVPLCIDESRYTPREAVREGGDDGIEVLYIGSFVPLHGIDVIIKAAQMLSDETDIRFTLAGTGQHAAYAAELMSRAPANIRRIDRWIPESEAATLMQNADICLGIFGDTHKSPRVWPYKNYNALACAKPLVTAATALPTESTNPDDICYVVPPADPQALAAAIRHLSGDSGLREKLASAGRDYYVRELSNLAAIRRFLDVVENAMGSE